MPLYPSNIHLYMNYILDDKFEPPLVHYNGFQAIGLLKTVKVKTNLGIFIATKRKRVRLVV